MQKHLDDGDAVPLSSVMAGFTHYNGEWWVGYADGWIAINDPELARRLDRTHELPKAADRLEAEGVNTKDP